MLNEHITKALKQVRELRARVIESQVFQGYSAAARTAGAGAALLGTLIMSLPFFPASSLAHIWGWGLVCAFAIAANLTGVSVWYLKQPADRRELSLLRPTVDAAPPLIVGAILTFAIINQEAYPLLFGAWMCVFGLVNCSTRRVLSGAICWLGAYYIICGAVCLAAAGSLPFTSPWPMGAVFFIGELAGARIFAAQRESEE